MKGKLITIFLSILILTPLLSQNSNPPDMRIKAQKLEKQGNYKDALEIYKELLGNENITTKEAISDFNRSINCINRLRAQDQFETLIDLLLKSREKDWEILSHAGNAFLNQAVKNGRIINGKFKRGYHQRATGPYVYTNDYDRVIALGYYEKALKLLPDNLQNTQKANFYWNFSYAVQRNRDYNRSYLLQDLTDSSEIPDLTQPHNQGYRYYGGGSKPPVDDDGNPKFYKIPVSYKEALNDGERWRWLLNEASKAGSENQADETYARFLYNQFGVHTLREYSWYFHNSKDKDTKSSILSLDKLTDKETIAKLASGIKKFDLPDEHNFISIYKRLILRNSQNAHRQLYSIYLNRRQFPKAVETIKEFLKKYPNDIAAKNQLKQITGNWGEFASSNSSTEGKEPTFDYRFRNGEEVSFKASKINMEKVIREVTGYIRTKPERLDYNSTNFYNLGQKVLKAKDRYLTGESESWDVKLTPPENHFNGRVTLKAPIKKSGPWLITSKMEDGNTCHTIIWISNTVIVQKSLDNQTLFYVTDAETGKPVSGAEVNFFGYRQEYKGRKGNKSQYEINTREFKKTTDKNGYIFVKNNEMDKNNRKNWLIHLNGNNRFAHMGFSSIYSYTYNDRQYENWRSYVLTDRPVYKPGQKVEYKAWTALASHNPRKHQVHRGNQTVEIFNPRNEKVFSSSHPSDEWGGINGTYVVPDHAPLGNYRIRTSHGSYSFRVEEYKKPEFEVLVEAPSKPVALGDKIKVTVNAKYYFGAPVSSGKIKVKVHRNDHYNSWYPVGPWDWFYGPGYGWCGVDCEWYPGWYRWGCKSPRPFWIPWHPPRPELVTEIEGRLKGDGTYSFEIDSSIAKAMYGEKSHNYAISVEVTDKSRRTIVGSGSVIAAKEPFKTFVWTDRSYYTTGQKINLSFQARNPSGKGVKGKAELKLFQIKYDEDGKAMETEIDKTSLETDENGNGSWSLTASKSGQFRISCTVTTEEGIKQEGAVIFSVYGKDTDTDSFKYNKLELLTDKKTYQPGDTLKLRINSDQNDATVLLFVRAVNGVCKEPQMIRMDGKSAKMDIKMGIDDHPNFFIEALTVSGGRLHSSVKQVFVPPENKLLKVEVLPEKNDYRPGQLANYKVKLTGPDGKPAKGMFCISVYDKALEYIAGNNKRSEIRKFFWQWKRSHYLRNRTSLRNYFRLIVLDYKQRMAQLGAFGNVGERSRGGLGASEGAMLNDLKEEAKTADSIAPGAPMKKASRQLAFASKDKDGGDGQNAPEAAAKVRKNFADSAFWKAIVKTDGKGEGEISFKMPENLTAWKARCWGIGDGFVIGEGETTVTTSKKLLLRLQAPRFFVETDEVVISANVHNYLKNDKKVRIKLEANNLLKALSGLEQTVTIPAGGEKRIDWRMKVMGEGQVVLRSFAFSDEESDAVEMKFPSKVHGILKTDSFSAFLAPDKNSQILNIAIPQKINPEETRLELRYSPTLAASMVDALPYLVSFPYGCTEQTLSRFLPTTITRKILEDMKIDMNEIRNKITNLNAQEIGNDIQRAKFDHLIKNPVFDIDKIKHMERAGITRLQNMQLSDGGWGWFSGWGERSSAHTTAYVIHGLQTAKLNGVDVNVNILNRGIQWLKNYQMEQAIKIRNWRAKKEKVSKKPHADNLDAFVYMVLIDQDSDNEEMAKYLYEDRNEIAVYGKAMMAMAFHKLKQNDKVAMLKRNIEQFLKIDNENQTAYLDLKNGGYWWYWYGSEWEAHAYYLKLLCKVEPKGKTAPMLVKYLVNNRRNATYWNSTRDTAICIEAMADFLRASEEMSPEMTVEIFADGKKVKEVEINRKNLFTFDNRLILGSEVMTSGNHKIEVRRKGKGPLYFNAYMTYFSKEEYIKKAGLEVKVQRKFYKLIRKEDKKNYAGVNGKVVKANQEAYSRVPIKDLDTLKSGDLIEVELEIESKNDYEYIVFEDLKAAGFETVDVRSGYRRSNNGMWSYQEMRNDRVAFFITRLPRGQHNLSYRLRAEIPGRFSALPAKVYANYAPELKGNSDEIKLQIED